MRPDLAAAPPTAPQRRLEPLLIVGFWAGIAVLTAIRQELDPRSGFLRPVLPAATLGLNVVMWSIWAALTPLVFRLSRRYPVDRAHWKRHVAIHLAVGVPVAVLVHVTVSFLVFVVFFRPRDPGFAFDPLFGIPRLMWLQDLLVYLTVLAVGVARDYFIRLQARHDEAVLLEAERARLEAQLAEARLAALRAQLDPHFLFNTLNAVSTLVGSDPRGVRRMIARLSGLLRYSLEGAAEPEVPLAQELDVLTQYVEIMEIRFEGQLRVEVDVDPGARDALVPNLIVQPLVENAIRHGVSRLPNATEGRVTVSARRRADESGDVVVVSVRDNGPALADGDALSRTGGVGLRNTRERLARLYGPEHTLTLTALPAGGVVAELTVPYHTRADLRAAGASVAATAAADDTPASIGAELT